MSRMETKHLTQKAVLWAASGVDDYGRDKLAAPIEISVRWEETRRETVDLLGNTVIIEAQVATDREIAVGSILWKGAQADLPSPEANLKEVIGYKEIPDVKGRNYRRVVLLKKHSDRLPTLA